LASWISDWQVTGLKLASWISNWQVEAKERTISSGRKKLSEGNLCFTIDYGGKEDEKKWITEIALWRRQHELG